MQFDPSNNVVKLCAEGMALEAQGKKEEAHQLFKEAWDKASSDFEAFTAAHYLARNQKEPEQNLYWNEVALERALLVKDGDMAGIFPSLYLNTGKSYEGLGNITKAAASYSLAAAKSIDLPKGPYSDMIKSGISEGLKRTGAAAYKNAKIDELVNSWCERKALKALSFILPAYIGNLGTENDINRLVSAFSYLSATGCLNEDDQQATDSLVIELVDTDF